MYNLYAKAQESTTRNRNYKKAAQQVFQKTVEPKGVKLLSFKELRSRAANTPQFNFKGNWFKEFAKLSTLNAYNNILEGNNSMYFYRSKEIGVNMHKCSVSAFHEMGHALNYNTKGIGKCLQSMKKAGGLVTAIAFLTAVFRKPSAPEETSESLTGRFFDFVKDNCVGIAAAGQLPNLFEEGLASVRGHNLAKKVINPTQLKNLAKVNGTAWLTYLTVSAATVLGVYVSDKVRNATC